MVEFSDPGLLWEDVSAVAVAGRFEEVVTTVEGRRGMSGTEVWMKSGEGGRAWRGSLSFPALLKEYMNKGKHVKQTKLQELLLPAV